VDVGLPKMGIGTQWKIIFIYHDKKLQRFSVAFKMHQLGLKLFRVIVWKLLIIKPFFNDNQIKSKLKIALEFGGVIGVVGKPLASQI